MTGEFRPPDLLAEDAEVVEACARHGVFFYDDGGVILPSGRRASGAEMRELVARAGYNPLTGSMRQSTGHFRRMSRPDKRGSRAMRFQLTINLDNDEAVTDGPELILPVYLSQVAGKCEAGHAGAGTVVDGNGNMIGRYAVEDGSRRADHFTDDEVDALIATAGDLYNETGDPNDVLSGRQRTLAARAYALLNEE